MKNTNNMLRRWELRGYGHWSVIEKATGRVIGCVGFYHPQGQWPGVDLGTLEIDGDRLDVQVNSERRSKRIEREIAKRLGADAVLEGKVADSVEKLLTERKDHPRDRLADAEQERLQQLPEVQEHMRQMGERHWKAWLDTRLPALGNRTPRQAAQTPDGRERLEALFAEFMWSTLLQPS